MPIPFDPGPVTQPFKALCENYPGPDVYPPNDFRVEWGPIFHRGRLDGSARVLVIGQDPGQHESIARRILVGEAGQRVQGFLARLGIETSYVMVNAFLYSVYGSAGAKYTDVPPLAAYRNAWLDALMVGNGIEGVVAFGARAKQAFALWKATPTGQGLDVAFEAVTHPTAPESSAKGDPVKYAETMARMLQGWNAALTRLAPRIAHPDTARPLVPYGAALAPGDLAPIPRGDLPAGSPAWMGGVAPWAERVGTTPSLKRATVVVTVPKADRPW
jgi:uracil-DNA glycosylase